MKVMITGAAGQVGRAVLQLAPPQAMVHALYREQLDIANAGAVAAAVQALRPDIIINAAAYTAVDKAQSEPETAAAINTDAPRFLAEAASSVPGCRMLQLSTDYVFDGRGSQPYKPGDPTNPQNVYGATKLHGERAVLEVLADRAVVLRTAWVYAAQGKNFVLTMLRLMNERGSVRVVADQHGTPTAAVSIAEALWRIAERPQVAGLLHWTDAGSTTWYEFARAIAEDAFALGLLRQAAAVTAITTSDYPTPARRPANSVLDLRDSAAQIGLSPKPWRTQLQLTLAAIAAGQRPH